MTAARTPRALVVQRVAAGLLGVVGFAPIWIQHAKREPSVWLPALVLLAGAVAIHRPGLGAQLFGRATWWANLLLGLLLTTGGRSEALQGSWLALCCSGALLILSTEGIAEARQRDGFAPAAFSTTLTLAMMLALADTQTLALFAALALDDGDKAAVLLGGSALAMIVSFVGLYRLRPWGVVANLLTNGVVAAIALSDGFDAKGELKALLVITAALQLVVAAPMLFGLWRGRPVAPLFGPKLRKRLSQGGLALAAAASALMLARLA